MTIRQYPEVGEEVRLNFEDGDSIPILLDHMLGAARLFQCRNPEGEVGIVAFQPDGSWWIVRDFVAPEGEEPWQQTG